MLNVRQLFGIIILTFLCVLVANAQSQGPPPSPRIKGYPPQKQSSNQQQKPEPDKRGTEQEPFVVKTISPQKSQTETEEDKKDHQEQASQNWWLVRFTGLLFAATVILASVAFWQGWQLKRSVNSLCHAERAYLFVRVSLANSGNPRENELVIGDNHIEAIATNYGKTPAVILNFQRFCQEILDKDIDERVKNMDKIAFKKKSAITPGTMVIGGGDSKRIYNTILPLDSEEWRTIRNFDKLKLVFIGVIHYKTIFGEIPKTVFCWQYEPFGDFRPDENPKHNYYT